MHVGYTYKPDMCWMKQNKTKQKTQQKNILKTNREGWCAYISTVERDIGTLSWVHNLGLFDYEINEQTNLIPCLLRRVYDEKRVKHCDRFQTDPFTDRMW